MAFSFKTFTELVTLAIDSVKANSSQIINFGEGSIIRVFLEAVSLLVQYFGVQLHKVYLIARAATSTGVDLDSFIADYGMDPRLAAVAATGNVTLARRTASSSIILIPVGSKVLTNDGSVSYSVVADASNPNFNASANGYNIPSNQLSTTAKVQADTAGVIGNVLANTITTIGSPVAGLDSVINASAFTNGVDQETDIALRIRFVAFIASLARSTKTAIQYACSIVQNGLKYVVQENMTIAGATQLGIFTVVIDDGTGNPPASLITAVAASIEKYRAFTVAYTVNAPTVLTTSVNCTITVASGYDGPTVKAAVQTALTNYLNSLNMGDFFGWARIADIAFSVTGVKDVDGMLLNGGTADISPLFNQVIKAGVITVT